jgi:hypothetical protein
MTTGRQVTRTTLALAVLLGVQAATGVPATSSGTGSSATVADHPCYQSQVAC